MQLLENVNDCEFCINKLFLENCATTYETVLLILSIIEEE